MKNKILLSSFAFLFLISFASATYIDYNCNVNYNMYNYVPMMFASQKIVWDTQNIKQTPCCESPILNNYNPKKVSQPIIIINAVESQHMVFNDCCSNKI